MCLSGIDPNSFWSTVTDVCLRDDVLGGSRDRILMGSRSSQAVAGRVDLSPFDLGREVVV